MGLYRKVIKIRGEDSPNVRLALAQIRAGKQPTGEMLVPGVLPWHDYQKRRQTWDKVKQRIGLDAEFYDGEELLLYPPDWLDLAERWAREVEQKCGRVRQGSGLGVDPAEGGDKTAFAVVDLYGLVHMEAYQTVDTSVIVSRTLALMREYDIPAGKVCFDRGGGGKEHVDWLRRMGYAVRTVGFGDPVTLELDEGAVGKKRRLDVREDRSAYKNRRAELYGNLRERLRPTWLIPATDADAAQPRFGIPERFTELRRQLSLMPLRYDQHGRMYLPPKTKKSKTVLSEKSLEEIIGHSPDEADALVIALWARDARTARLRVGAAW